MKSKVIRRCGDCGRFLSEDDFHWSNKRKGWKRACCKRCDANRNYLWKLDNKERRALHSKRWEEKNKELRKQFGKQWRKENKERQQSNDRKYYIKNKRYINERNKQYCKNNRDKVYTAMAKRRAAKYNQTPLLTDEEKNRINFIYGVASIMADYHVDHIQPLSKGGLHHPDNLQILHKNLNLEKFNKYPLTKEEKIRYSGFKL